MTGHSLVGAGYSLTWLRGRSNSSLVVTPGAAGIWSQGCRRNVSSVDAIGIQDWCGIGFSKAVRLHAMTLQVDVHRATSLHQIVTLGRRVSVPSAVLKEAETEARTGERCPARAALPVWARIMHGGYTQEGSIPADEHVILDWYMSTL